MNPQILKGYVNNTVTTLANNNTYVVVELFDRDDSSYVNVRFQSVTQRTPQGQDYVMFAYVSITAPKWNELGFGLNERIFMRPVDWEKPAHNPFAFGSTIQYGQGRPRWGSGSWAEYVTRPRGQVENKWDRYQVNIVDVGSWDFNAENKGFYLRLNDRPQDIVFNPDYGIGRWRAYPESNTEYLYSKDGDRAKSHYNTGNHKVRGFDWETV